MSDDEFLVGTGGEGEGVPTTHRRGFVWYHQEEVDGYKSWFSCRPGSPCRPDTQVFLSYCKAVFAMHGSILLWVGAWNLISGTSRGYGGNPADPATSTPLVYNRGIMWAYIVSGLVACSLVDTLYSQAGMDTPLNPREGLVPPQLRWWTNRRRRVVTPQYVVRIIVGYLGMFLLWIGMYSVLEHPAGASQLRSILYWSLGTVALLGMQTLECMANLFPSTLKSPRSYFVRRAAKAVRRIKSFEGTAAGGADGICDWLGGCIREEWLSLLKCIASLWAQNMVWAGSWNVMLYSLPETVDVRSVVFGYWLGGQALLVVCQCYLNLSWIDVCPALQPANDGSWDPKKREKAPISALFYLRLLTAIVAQMMFQAGFWTLLDEYVVTPTWYRDLIYAVLGASMCLFSGTIYSNVGIIPPQFLNLALSPDDNTNTPVSNMMAGDQEGGETGEVSAYEASIQDQPLSDIEALYDAPEEDVPPITGHLALDADITAA